MSRPKVSAHRGDYWEPVWREGLYCPPYLPGDLDEDPRRREASAIIHARTEGNTRCGVRFQEPLGQTYIDPVTWLDVYTSMREAQDRFHWFNARIRHVCDNDIGRFLELYATIEGRARLCVAGLRLYDDSGNLVNARGDLALESGKRPGQTDLEYWMGDESREPVSLTAHVHHNPPDEVTQYEPRTVIAVRRRGEE